MGTVEELKTVLDVICREGPPRGLNLNPDKSSVWCPQAIGLGEADPLQRNAQCVIYTLVANFAVLSRGLFCRKFTHF